MNPLSRFRWYRRARGGYWAQVTSFLLTSTHWVRMADNPIPMQNGCWEFYPWAKKEMGNGYIDEWHCSSPYYAVPLSSITVKAIDALKLAIKTVECDSTDKNGNPLPWYKSAHEVIMEFESNSALTPK